MKKFAFLALVLMSVSAHASTDIPNYEAANLFEQLSSLQIEGMIDAKDIITVVNGNRVETITTNKVSCTHTEISTPDENGSGDDYTCKKI